MDFLYIQSPVKTRWISKRHVIAQTESEVLDAEITGSDSKAGVMWEVRQGELVLQASASTP